MSNGTRLILLVIGLIHRVHDLEELVSSRRELRQSIQISEVMENRIILYLYRIEALEPNHHLGNLLSSTALIAI